MPKPSPRRDGREAALQYLFANEDLASPDAAPTAEELELFWELRQANEKVQGFAEDIIKGVHLHLGEIDERITKSLTNFKLDRLTRVDRNILRVGTYEICFSDHIPAAAAVNEAIEIAKRFGTEGSAKFVNGVLDQIMKEAEASKD